VTARDLVSSSHLSTGGTDHSSRPDIDAQRLLPWPSIDVVIPTFNCAANLERCLRAVRDQRYGGQIEVIVVDGGSTDGTIDVASRFRAAVFVNPGQYGTGRSGARHFGERQGKGELVWCLDSDNHLVGSEVAQALVRPFLDEPGVAFAVPLTAEDPTAAPFANWFAVDEVEQLTRIGESSRKNAGAWIVPDMMYGLSNACLIRRDVLEFAGGYDSDVRLLRRLRVAHLSKAAIVPAARFYHNQTRGVLDFCRKWTQRIVFYARLSDTELAAHFVELPTSPETRGERVLVIVRRMARSFLRPPVQFARSGDPAWLAGLAYVPALLLILLRHPFAARRVIKRLL